MNESEKAQLMFNMKEKNVHGINSAERPGTATHIPMASPTTLSQWPEGDPEEGQGQGFRALQGAAPLWELSAASGGGRCARLPPDPSGNNLTFCPLTVAPTPSQRRTLLERWGFGHGVVGGNGLSHKPCRRAGTWAPDDGLRMFFITSLKIFSHSRALRRSSSRRATILRSRRMDADNCSAGSISSSRATASASVSEARAGLCPAVSPRIRWTREGPLSKGL